jgi:hypothetical protein
MRSVWQSSRVPILLAQVAVLISCGGDPFETAPGTGGAGGGEPSSSTGAGGSESCSPGQTAPCYDGPASTQGVGTCVGGTKVCNLAGDGYGECQGTTVPAADDDCATPEDENCNGESNDGCTCEPTSVEECYSGPAGTAGVGLCVAGTHTCKADASWGVCVDEVAPVAEDCSNDTDEDCDGASCGEVVWVELSNGTANDHIFGTAIDDNGDIYLAGQFGGTMDFGGGAPVISAGAEDAFVAKLSSSGTVLWLKRIGSAAAEAATDVAVSPLGGIVVVGGFTGALTIGSDSYPANELGSSFVVRMTDSGDVVWSSAVNGTMGVGEASVAVDATTGRIVVADAYWDAPDFSEGRLRAMTDAGAPLWTRTLVGPGTEGFDGVAIDASGSVVAVASAGSGAAFESQELSGDGSSDALVVKLDDQGGVSWLNTQGGPATDAPRDVAVAPNGDIVIAGFTLGSMTLAGTIFPHQGEWDAFVLRMGPGGNHLWANVYGDVGNDTMYGVATDGAGDVFLTGAFKNTVDFGGGPFSIPSTATNAFVLKLDAAGAHMWSRHYAGATSGGEAVAVGADGTAVLVGYIYGETDFGQQVTPVSGHSEEAFVAAIAP